MSLNKLVEKAKKLLKSRRVENVGGGVYNVVGDHGTYTVVQDYEGNVGCNCPGFVSRRKCSYSTAVLRLTRSLRKRRGRREI